MAQDMIAFMTELDLEDVVFYGFSDGGIIALLAAMNCSRITDLVVSGANLTTKGTKMWFRLLLQAESLRGKDPLIELMKNEPDIASSQLSAIRARTLVTAGSRDLIREAETKEIADKIPGAKLMILKGETHGSYIVHSTKIADILIQQVM
jgi:pimeloyl-ACP methyl ester carboxylesterase